LIQPRYAWVPPRAKSLGPDCVACWKAAGGALFDWQEFVIDGILGVAEDGRWASTDDGMTVARQNGKGVILQAVEVFVAFELGHSLGYDLILHTAHEFATSQDHQLRLDEFIQNCPHLHARVKDRGGYMHSNGRESINLKDGTRIIFKARTKGGGRGYSGDLLAWDEAMVVPDAVVGAQKPMLRACQGVYGPKTIYAGSAVDQEVHEYGVNFARIRERGIARSPRVSYFEWSAPFDHPSELTDDLLHDRSHWPAGNPSMEDGLVSADYMADEIETMPARTAATELFDVGDWPRTDGLDEMVVSIEAWDRLADPESALQPPYCLAFDVSPERHTAISLAGHNQRDLFHVEIQECKQGTLWAPTRIAAMVESGDIEVVLCDGASPAASLIVKLEELGVMVETVNASEHGQACGRLVDMVTDGTLAHLGSDELRDAIRGAKTRPLNDAWAWSRRNSSVNIAPLVAATLSLGAAAGVAGGEVAIF
jgi:hypothetical protein